MPGGTEGVEDCRWRRGETDLAGPAGPGPRRDRVSGRVSEPGGYPLIWKAMAALIASAVPTEVMNS